jgi:hypothetical protein
MQQQNKEPYFRDSDDRLENMTAMIVSVGDDESSSDSD